MKKYFDKSLANLSNKAATTASSFFGQHRMSRRADFVRIRQSSTGNQACIVSPRDDLMAAKHSVGLIYVVHDRVAVGGVPAEWYWRLQP